MTLSGAAAVPGSRLRLVEQEPDPEPLLSVVGVGKCFGSVTALAGAELAVKPGSIHGLLGPNGAGKTTLLRVIFGLVRPDNGLIEVLGGPPSSAVARTGGVAGFVDSPRFYPYFSARKNLELLAALDGERSDEAIQEVLEQCGLLEVQRRRVGAFSTGQRQRLALAAALLRQPRLLIVDEPTTGLDPLGVIDLHVILRAIAGSGAAVLLSSHDMSEVELVCDAVTVLNHGRTSYTGSMDGLRAQAPDPTYRLITSDDEAALRIVGQSLHATRHRDGGLLIRGDVPQLDRLTIELGRASVAIRELQRQDSALEAMFLQLIAADGDADLRVPAIGEAP
ncbi:ABC-2 type transport system ATP-binding protein [Frankineae bacterium MT45]|nr:ABC-2 type transport system ATP-binding protein [Frankineae bacterium MT45]